MQAMENAGITEAAWADQVTEAAQALGDEVQVLAKEGLSAYTGTRAEMTAQADALTAEIASLTQRAYKDGEVLQVMAREGELLLPGSPGAVLSSLDAEIRAEVSSRDSRQITEGMRARISINSMPLGEAVVEKVGLLKPNAQGIPYAQVVLTPLDGLSVNIGTQVDVDVILEAQTQVPVVPAEAVTDKDTVFQVYEGRAWEQNAAVRLWDGNWAALGDLPVGTELVLSPEKDLRDGVRLKVVSP